MKQKFFLALAAAGVMLWCANAIAAQMEAAGTPAKPISKVSDVNAMPDDAEVVIQGVIVQDLGDEHYLLKDDSGTINIEIDEDLIGGDTITPEATVLISATVDKDGDITSLDAEEIQFVPDAPAVPATPAMPSAPAMPAK